MLKIVGKKIPRTDDEIEDLYKNCKYVSIIDSYDKVAENSGYLYCVSTSENSFDALIDEEIA